MRVPSFLLAIGLVGCAPGDRVAGDGVPGDPVTTWTTGTPTGTSTDPTLPGLEVPDVVRLPAVDVGASTPSAALLVTATGEVGALTVEVTGPFAVTGDLSAIADETRELSVAFTGPLDAPGLFVGSVVVTADAAHTVALAAVVTDPGLPATVNWIDDGLGMSAFVALPSAPYPTAGGLWTDPTVWIRVPAGLTAPFATVTHLHGHYAVLDDMLASKQLPELYAAAGRNAVVIVPQGPVDAASGDFGRLMDAGGHAALVTDVVGLAYRDGLIALPESDGVVLSAHSGGYVATAAIVDRGGLPVDEVHLYDALYGESATFEAFARDGGVLRSLYTSYGGTVGQNQSLAVALSDAFAVGDAFSDAALRSDEVIIGWSPAAHGSVMGDDRNLERWLEAALMPDAWAPPQLLAATSDGSAVTVAWRDEGLEAVVEGSDDGATWTALGRGADGAATVDARPWLRVRYGDGDPSDAYPAAGDGWLVVDGFDRILSGSYQARTHPFAAWLGEALPAASGASNEAVAEGLVALSAYDHVLWMLGDESTADRTFTEAEAAAIRGYLAGGGKLLISGAELGYATDGAFLDELGIAYVADDAGTLVAGGWRFGVAYEEDYPDVLAGDQVVWTYDGGGAAAVRSGNVLAVGFGLETLHPDDRDAALAELLAGF